MIGRTLAQYEITALLGKGGMGEVYRAHDSKLKREVALKILPQGVSDDPERAARFEREAQTLASLQHANVASIYGYEKIDGVRFLAMELVEGEDLGERLARGPVPMDEALGIALQIAIGLEAAHERNIVHRDLKPANVKVDPEGTVKILDFGLARALTGDPNDTADPALSPTITAAMTQAGTILGTAAYMSPEQARGKYIDKRSDIWSFGVMLYEMLTRKQLYDGETITDILGAIVHGTPDLELLPSGVPASVRALLHRCLTPDAQNRLRDIGEARYVLNDPHATTPVDTGRVAGRSSGPWMAAALALLVVAAGLGFLLWKSPQPESTVIQSSIPIPEGQNLQTLGSRGGAMRVSPDGRFVAFVAQAQGTRQIWIRPLDQREGHPVQGTEGGFRPFWSPDGRSIGFFANGNLRRVAISGGAPLTVAPAADGRGAVWLPGGQIVFAPTPSSALFAVSAGGGEPRPVTDPGTRTHREPRALPQDDRFLFLENLGGGEWGVSVGHLDGQAHTRVTLTGGGAEFAEGRLLYLRGRTLVAQPFDTNTFELSGEPVPLAENVVRDINYGVGAFSASNTGMLCYQSGRGAGSQLVWKDRRGATIRAHAERADYTEAALSWDGKTIAAVVEGADGSSSIWLLDVERDLRRRITFKNEAGAKRRGEILWTRDNRSIVYTLEFDGGQAIYTKPIDGSGEERKVLEIPGTAVWGYDVSPDDQWVLYGLANEDARENLWIAPLSGEGERRPIHESPADEWPGSFSPDGRWVAIDSNETGRREIYVVATEVGTGRWQVSRNGGRYPQWSAAGDELFFVDLTGRIMATQVDTSGPIFRSDEPVELYEAGLTLDASNESSVDPSGESFLIIEKSVVTNPLSLFLNWRQSIDER